MHWRTYGWSNPMPETLSDTYIDHQEKSRRGGSISIKSKCCAVEPRLKLDEEDRLFPGCFFFFLSLRAEELIRHVWIFPTILKCMEAERLRHFLGITTTARATAGGKQVACRLWTVTEQVNSTVTYPVTERKPGKRDKWMNSTMNDQANPGLSQSVISFTGPNAVSWLPQGGTLRVGGEGERQGKRFSAKN